MSNEIIEHKTFSLAPQNLTEAMKFAEMLAKSSLVPVNFKNKPGDIIAAIQLGAEVGLQPIQALQNIAVINGRPCLWGDSLLALVQSHPAFEWIKEEDDGHTATCVVKRKNGPEHVVKFSMDDAKLAGLAGRKGPWTQYPKRMRQMRARGFALRDQFADALMGLQLAEEVRDYQIKQPKKIVPDDFELKEIQESQIETDSNGLEIVATEEQIQEFLSLHHKLMLSDAVINKVLEAAGVDNIMDMPKDKMQKWIDSLKKKIGDKK